MTRAMAWAVAAAGMHIFGAPALAQAPVALVEDVRGNPAGIEIMDYVSTGKVIKLSSRIRSCSGT